MSEQITIEIDNTKIVAYPGEMLIQVADREGIYIPRFCYHKKLRIAANCRMCLVEVKNVPKTLPACATPVMDGMKVFTKSAATIKSQNIVMEFLLANHPLDCPVCDQGGECELQDYSIEYGESKSRFDESKRSVADENLGPLVATEMTRCIHCTRCVRFCEEIAGTKGLGAFGRGGDMKIGTFLTKGLKNELSGNVIDLCPVGALTSKPFKYNGRSWEFKQHLAVSPHDNVGSNIYIHTQDQNYGDESTVMRILPRDNEEVNESWIADRDRYSYNAIKSDDRLTKPMMKKSGRWQSVSWEKVLPYISTMLLNIKKEKQEGEIGALISPSASLEECYLLQKLMRAIGSNNIDHRITTTDFSDQENIISYPGFTEDICLFARKKCIILVGSFAREEQPLLFHRVRQAVGKGAKLIVINSYDYDFASSIFSKLIVQSAEIPNIIANIVSMLNLDANAVATFEKHEYAQELKNILQVITDNKSDIAIVSGEHVESHPQASHIRSSLAELAKTTDASLHFITKGSNASGAWLAGAIPHREELAKDVNKNGLNAESMLAQKLAVYILHGIEPEYDCINPKLALEALHEADEVITISSFVTPRMKKYSTILLPLACFSEFSGHFVNCEGRVQKFNAATLAKGSAKPGWKIYRVLGELMGFDSFKYDSHIDVVIDIIPKIKAISSNGNWTKVNHSHKQAQQSKSSRIGHWHAFRADPLVRRSIPLQETLSGDSSVVRLHKDHALKLNINTGDNIILSQNGIKQTFTCEFDNRVAIGDFWLSSGNEAGVDFGAGSGDISFVEKEVK